MSAIFFLIGCSVLMALIFLAAFFWANKSGQHDDTYTPSVRILFDDELQGDVSHSNKDDHSSGSKPDLDSDTDPE